MLLSGNVNPNPETYTNHDQSNLNGTPFVNNGFYNNETEINLESDDGNLGNKK